MKSRQQSLILFALGGFFILGGAVQFLPSFPLSTVNIGGQSYPAACSSFWYSWGGGQFSTQAFAEQASTYAAQTQQTAWKVYLLPQGDYDAISSSGLPAAGAQLVATVQPGPACPPPSMTTTTTSTQASLPGQMTTTGYDPTGWYALGFGALVLGVVLGRKH
ncbi:MAG: hypothetical protein KGI38_11835 [Thaumarchaeota archaeon]|nr:hypothetical protein [Nitrososphaerota archaeon]